MLRLEVGMDEHLQELTQEYKDIFMGQGRGCKVPPIQIEVDPSVTLVQQKARPLSIHYKQKLRKHPDLLIL